MTPQKEAENRKKREAEVLETVKARLDEITAKEPESLTEEEVAFLRARRTYLTSDQLKAFEEVLEVAEAPAEKPLKKLSDEELAAKATELGLDPKKFSKRKDLIAAIEEKLASA